MHPERSFAKGFSTHTLSPKAIFFFKASPSKPVSINSESLSSALLSSPEERWGGTLHTIPFTGSLPIMTTSSPARTRQSIPPQESHFTNPFSSINLTISPILSIWASRRIFFPLAPLFMVQKKLPRLSVVISPFSESKSFKTEIISFSLPDTPPLKVRSFTVFSISIYIHLRFLPPTIILLIFAFFKAGNTLPYSQLLQSSIYLLIFAIVNFQNVKTKAAIKVFFI